MPEVVQCRLAGDRSRLSLRSLPVAPGRAPVGLLPGSGGSPSSAASFQLSSSQLSPAREPCRHRQVSSSWSCCSFLEAGAQSRLPGDFVLSHGVGAGDGVVRALAGALRLADESCACVSFRVGEGLIGVFCQSFVRLQILVRGQSG